MGHVDHGGGGYTDGLSTADEFSSGIDGARFGFLDVWGSSTGDALREVESLAVGFDLEGELGWSVGWERSNTANFISTQIGLPLPRRWENSYVSAKEAAMRVNFMLFIKRMFLGVRADLILLMRQEKSLKWAHLLSLSIILMLILFITTGQSINIIGGRVNRCSGSETFCLY